MYNSHDLLSSRNGQQFIESPIGKPSVSDIGATCCLQRCQGIHLGFQLLSFSRGILIYYKSTTFPFHLD
jgi:hypothetical protein